LVTYGGVHVVDAESGEIKTLTEPGAQGIVKVQANTLYLAGSGSIFAYRMSDGKRLWSHRIGRKEKLVRMAVSADDERAVKVHVFSEDTEYVLDAKNGKEDYSRGLPEEGETTEDHASDEPSEPYDDEDSPRSAKLRWVKDGFIGVSIGDGTMAGIDLRRDPNAPHLRAGKQTAPKWSPKKLGLTALVGTLKRDASAEKK
jgi:hypothetical protein